MNDKPFEIAIDARPIPVQQISQEIEYVVRQERIIDFEFRFKGETVFRMHSARIDVIMPGFAALAEMVSRANASFESESEDQHP